MKCEAVLTDSSSSGTAHIVLLIVVIFSEMKMQLLLVSTCFSVNVFFCFTDPFAKHNKTVKSAGHWARLNVGLIPVCLDRLPVGLVNEQNPPVQNGSERGSAAAAHDPVPETSKNAACEERKRHDTRENGAGSVFTFSQFLQDESCVCVFM